MRIRLIAALTAGCLCAGAMTASAAVDPDDLAAAQQQLEAARERLSAARATYEQATVKVRAAETERATAQAKLADAEAALDAAVRRTKRAERVAATREAELADHASAAFKHGMLAGPEIVLRAVTRADGTHEMAVAFETAGRLLERDSDVVDDARRAAAAAAAARAEATRRRQEVTRLAERAKQAVRAARQAAAEQRQVVRDVAADKEAAAALVAELERQLASVGQVLRTPRMVDFGQPAPAWAASLPGGGYGWAGAVDAAAARAGVDGRFFAALVWTESRFQTSATSPVGAIGLAQLMPGTARLLGVNPYDPIENLSGGARYLRQQLEEFGNLEHGLAAYNAGPGRVEQSGGVPDIVETRLYVLTVVERWRSLL